MNLAGPTIIAGRRPLRILTLVGVTARRGPSYGTGEVVLTLAGSGKARRERRIVGTGSLLVSASGKARLRRRAKATSTLSVLGSGAARRRRKVAGSVSVSVLATGAGRRGQTAKGAAVALTQATGFAQVRPGWVKAGTTFDFDAAGNRYAYRSYRQSLDLNFLSSASDAYYLGSAEMAAYSSLTDFIAAMGGTFTRASVATYKDANGVWQTAAANVPRLDYASAGVARGFLRESARTNKNTNFNAAPALTNIGKTGDAAATLAIVDDSAALAAVGLNALVPSGQVYKLDNTLGTGAAYATINGVTGNLNPHTASAFVRTTGGIGRVRTNSLGGVVVNPDLPYARTAFSFTPGTASDGFWIYAIQGGITYFVLNQLEEGAFASSPIIVAGSAATRAADSLTFPTAGWLNPNGGAWVAEFESNGRPSGVIQGVFYTVGGDGYIRSTVEESTISYRVAALGSIGQASFPVADTGLGVKKSAMRYAPNDFAFSVNGAAPVTDTGGAVPQGQATLFIGSLGTGVNPLDGWIRRLYYVPAGLTNAELQAVTA
ncbi:hypothetical protein [Enterovirga sp. CN4-39]|uniref:hypothetical protein n=1 Tax=Enterovirga sp. CN4-39 TaxID=3400910 RepID=UPI003C0D4E73